MNHINCIEEIRQMLNSVNNNENKLMFITRSISDLDSYSQVKNNIVLDGIGSLLLSKCNRVEVIDKNGRVYTNKWGADNVMLQIQDNERTLKVFIKE